MSKSSVERYEQLLSQDPTSGVFVELAKALIDKGDAARAVEVCAQGLVHHPGSVTGRVLWGKALIHMGRPAEAMEQFDQAVAIDRDNPHAYNLIGEVLLQRGLYRSALPLLRKAVALQPNDARVKDWLEQAQRALAGGPAPVLQAPPPPPPVADEAPAAAGDDSDRTSVIDAATLARALANVAGAEAPAAAPAAPAAPPAVAAGVPAAAASTSGPVQVPMAGPGAMAAHAARIAGGGSNSGSRRPAGPAGPVPRLTPVPLAPGDASGTPGIAGPRVTPGAGTPGLSPDAGAAAPGAMPWDETPGLAAGAAPSWPTPGTGTPALGASAPRSTPGAGTPGLTPAGGTPGLTGARAAPPPPAAVEPGLLGDLGPSDTGALSAARLPALTPSGGLLLDLPDVGAEPAPAASAPAVSSEAAEKAAREYEKELREKLAVQQRPPALVARHGRTLAVVGVVGVALLVGLGVFLARRHAQGGQTLAGVLETAERRVGEDTPAGYRAALEQLALARDMDDGNARAWALTAWAEAVLAAEHGGGADARGRARAALEQPGVAQAQEGLALAATALAAEGDAREPAREAVLASQAPSPELHALAGALLLEQRAVPAALERFKRALSLSPRNVRALVALGRYYQGAGDTESALKVYASALEASPEHPAVRVGLAECRLELGAELEASLADLRGLDVATLPPALAVRHAVALGRLLAASGQAAEARTLLERVARGPQGFEAQLALGEAARAVGDLAAAQRAYEAALAVRAGDEEARAGLGRVLLERDRPREALKRLNGTTGRRLSLVRGIAHARLGDAKRARAELAQTRVEGRFPTEAVIHLALLDAADGRADEARGVLEKTLAATKRARAGVQVALGTVLWRQGRLDAARTQLEAAAKDGGDPEAPCALGRLLLSSGSPEAALPHLQRAVDRNGSHGEARDALARAQLMLGRPPEALAQAEAWVKDNPDAGAAHKALALVLWRAGRGADAEGALARAFQRDGADAEAFRLRALLRFAAGDGKGGFAALERANRLDPKDPETFCEVAHAFWRQGDPERAEAAFAAARREGPAASCGQIGEHWSGLPEGGRGAARAAEALAARAPAVWDRAFARATAARALLGAGALKEARAAADEAVALAPHTGRSHLALGLVAARQRDAATARTALTRAVELEPTDGEARLALADALADAGPTELARAVGEYEAFLRVASGAEDAERVRRLLPALKKRAGAR